MKILFPAEPTKRVQLTAIPVSKNWQFGKEDIDELLFMLEVRIFTQDVFQNCSPHTTVCLQMSLTDTNYTNNATSVCKIMQLQNLCQFQRVGSFFLQYVNPFVPKLIAWGTEKDQTLNSHHHREMLFATFVDFGSLNCALHIVVNVHWKRDNLLLLICVLCNQNKAGGHE